MRATSSSSRAISSPGHPARRDERGQLLAPAAIGCTLPEVFDDTRPGERIWLDDGRIGGVSNGGDRRVIVRIDRTRLPGRKTGAPTRESTCPRAQLQLPALTAKDSTTCEFIAKHADLVSLSFVNAPRTSSSLQHVAAPRRRASRHRPQDRDSPGFEALPEMLLAALRSPRCGVMIARGDLAVECGFERLAELQEEILWVCEAAHVPVIWATQVLENLAKNGAAVARRDHRCRHGRAGRVRHVEQGAARREAVRVLDDILKRMQAHVTKKRSMLRELQLARQFLSGASVC